MGRVRTEEQSISCAIYRGYVSPVFSLSHNILALRLLWCCLQSSEMVCILLRRHASVPESFMIVSSINVLV